MTYCCFDEKKRKTKMQEDIRKMIPIAALVWHLNPQPSFLLAFGSVNFKFYVYINKWSFVMFVFGCLWCFMIHLLGSSFEWLDRRDGVLHNLCQGAVTHIVKLLLLGRGVRFTIRKLGNSMLRKQFMTHLPTGISI